MRSDVLALQRAKPAPGTKKLHAANVVKAQARMGVYKV